MSELRRRANSVQATTGEDGGINEPLLGDTNQLLEQDQTPSLVELFLLGWQAMVYYVNWFMNMSFGVPTPEKVSKFTKLRESAQVPYNEDDPEHQVREHYDGVSKGPYMRFSSAFLSIFNSTMVELASLWKHCFPTEPWYCGPSDRWKDAGFQGSNPAHDFRGGGIFSLRNLIYMAKHHKNTFHRLLWKEAGERSDFEYPFCAAGINLTFYVQQLLELRSPTRASSWKTPSSKVGRNFLNILDENESAFEEVYVASFEVLDRIWLERAASYMEFPTVLNDTMSAVKEALLQSPLTIADLRESLDLSPEGS